MANFTATQGRYLSFVFTYTDEWVTSSEASTRLFPARVGRPSDARLESIA